MRGPDAWRRPLNELFAERARGRSGHHSLIPHKGGTVSSVVSPTQMGRTFANAGLCY
jgi:hypothetical protein